MARLTTCAWTSPSRASARPLHPGALRYYREQGLQIPERLIYNATAEVSSTN